MDLLDFVKTHGEPKVVPNGLHAVIEPRPELGLVPGIIFALRNRTLSQRAASVMQAAPGCVLIAVIAPYFVSDKPHELIAIALTAAAASRLPMLPTVLLGVVSSGLLGHWMK